MGSGAAQERTRSWRADRVSISAANGTITIVGNGTTVLTEADINRLTVAKGLLFRRVELDGQSLGRIGRHPARQLQAETFALAARPDIRAAYQWSNEVDAALRDAAEPGRWFTTEEVDTLIANRPDGALADRIEAAAYEDLFTEAELAAARRLDGDLHAEVAALN